MLSKMIEYLYTGCPVYPVYLFKSRKRTLSAQMAMKLGGQLEMTLLRVCKLSNLYSMPKKQYFLGKKDLLQASQAGSRNLDLSVPQVL